MTETRDNFIKAKRCQVVGCKVDLKELGKPYNLKKRLCAKHMGADVITRAGSEGQWRFCQQCGKLEPLQLFQGNRRSCTVGLQRRRNSNRNAAAEKQPQNKQQAPQVCQAGGSVSGLGCQAGECLSGPRCQAGEYLASFGLEATWNSSLAAAATAHVVGNSNGNDSSRMQQILRAHSVRSLNLLPASPPTSAAAAAGNNMQGGLPPSLQKTSAAIASAAAAEHDVWSEVQLMQVPGMCYPTTSLTSEAPTPAPEVTAGNADLQPWTAAAPAAVVAPMNGSTGFDMTDMAVLDEIEQHLVDAVNALHQQEASAAAAAALHHAQPLAQAAAKGAMVEQLQGDQTRAATIAKLHELSQQFEILHQAFCDDFASELGMLQQQRVVQQQQQQLFGNRMPTASCQASVHAFHI